ncbi:MAG: hypothetical protein HDR88_07240 [Bacteroides sp.]|nr:hypothetical protein [Bacteroides sp.]
MKANIKQIPRPELKSARRLSPLQLNTMRCDKRHSVLTPEQVEKLSAAVDQAELKMHLS